MQAIDELYSLRLLLEDGNCPNSVRVLRQLNGLSKIAKRGEFKLKTRAEINENELKSAISGVVGRAISSIFFISLQKPNLIANEFAEKLSEKSILESMDKSLIEQIGHNYAIQAKARIMESFGDKLAVSLFKTLNGNNSDGLFVSIWNSLMMTLILYVGYAYHFKKENFERFLLLLKQWENCLIINEKDDSPGTWLVVVK